MNRMRIKDSVITNAYRVWFPAPSRDPRGPQEAFGLMHFGFYLTIAALVLMGLQVIYVLYQLATFVL